MTCIRVEHANTLTTCTTHASKLYKIKKKNGYHQQLKPYNSQMYSTIHDFLNHINCCKKATFSKHRFDDSLLI